MNGKENNYDEIVDLIKGRENGGELPPANLTHELSQQKLLPGVGDGIKKGSEVYEYDFYAHKLFEKYPKYKKYEYSLQKYIAGNVKRGTVKIVYRQPARLVEEDGVPKLSTVLYNLANMLIETVSDFPESPLTEVEFWVDW